jgi:hypothetical protein
MADMFRGTLPGGALRLSQDGEPLYHYSYLSAFAESCVVPEGCCVVIRDDAPLEVAALVGCAVMTGYGAVVNRARGCLWSRRRGAIRSNGRAAGGRRSRSRCRPGRVQAANRARARSHPRSRSGLGRRARLAPGPD